MQKKKSILPTAPTKENFGGRGLWRDSAALGYLHCTRQQFPSPEPYQESTEPVINPDTAVCAPLSKNKPPKMYLLNQL